MTGEHPPPSGVPLVDYHKYPVCWAGPLRWLAPTGPSAGQCARGRQRLRRSREHRDTPRERTARAAACLDGLDWAASHAPSLRWEKVGSDGVVSMSAVAHSLICRFINPFCNRANKPAEETIGEVAGSNAVAGSCRLGLPSPATRRPRSSTGPPRGRWTSFSRGP